MRLSRSRSTTCKTHSAKLTPLASGYKLRHTQETKETYTKLHRNAEYQLKLTVLRVNRWNKKAIRPDQQQRHENDQHSVHATQAASDEPPADQAETDTAVVLKRPDRDTPLPTCGPCHRNPNHQTTGSKGPTASGAYQRRWHWHLHEDDFAPYGAILCGACYLTAARIRERQQKGKTKSKAQSRHDPQTILRREKAARRAGPAEAPRCEIGAWTTMHQLNARTELNGLAVQLQRYEPTQQRWVVHAPATGEMYTVRS